MYQGTRWVLLEQKKRSRISHAWAPLNQPTQLFKKHYLMHTRHKEMQQIYCVELITGNLLTLIRAAVKIDVSLQLEVVFDFPGDQKERGRLYVMPRP